MFKDFKEYMVIKLYVMIYFFIPLLCYSNICFRVEGLDGELDYNVCKNLYDLHVNAKYIDADLKKKFLMQ